MRDSNTLPLVLYLLLHILRNNGVWPSGKAPGFGPGIRGFESLHPSQISFNYFNQTTTPVVVWFLCYPWFGCVLYGLEYERVFISWTIL